MIVDIQFFPKQVQDAAKQAQTLEYQGYNAVWIPETGHNPFFPLVLAATHTRTLKLATGIAVALARSPMTLAQEAWDMAALSEGRFILGLGSQVQAHITKRFSMKWDKPVAQMRDFVLALRAIWASFQNGTPLKYEGEYYKHTLLTPFFSPGPIAHPQIPIAIAAVGPKMTEMAAEVADGVLLHAFTTRQYFESVTRPAIQRGLAGRDPRQFFVAGPVFVVTGEGKTRAKMEAMVRSQIAFYGSTPAYAEVLEGLGHGELHRTLHKLSREGKWDEMAALIPEDVLHAFAVCAPLDGLAAALRARYSGLYDRLVMYLPLPETEPDAVRALIEAIEAPPTPV
ncbi:MAG: TIGR03617 family F420-dependent LLM class oxidoreductase [Candidatus Xenobia bacterium]